MFSIIMGFSGFAYASELTKEQQDLKENELGYWGVSIFLQEGVEVIPLLDDDMQELLEDYKLRAETLKKRGVLLPDSEEQNIKKFKEMLLEEIKQAKKACQ